MIWNVATKLVSGLSDGNDKKSAIRNSLVKRTLGLADKGIPIGREDEPVGYFRWKAQENDEFTEGALEPESGSKINWCDFIWRAGETIDECIWEEVRWRFYSNGLVCFNAQMSNESSKMDNGDVQGHRIELRETNGLLLGVWIAGFFVRRSLPTRGFAASFQDEHPPLKLHFDDIEKSQRGAWVCL